MEYPNFKVCTLCWTFNQARFIADTLGGFVKQKTDFPFVCCIVDDASTDGEQKEIKEYIDGCFDTLEERETPSVSITFSRHNTNRNCYFAVLYLKENHYSIHKEKGPYLTEWRDASEYEALCEGEDYWTDEGKLQKQALFLDSHPESVAVHTAFSMLIETTGEKKDFVFRFKPSREDLPRDIINWKYRIQTCTAMYRSRELKKLEEKDPLYFSGHFLMGDTQLWMGLNTVGEIGYIEDVTSVYRVVEGSASHSADYLKSLRFTTSLYERVLYESKRYVRIPFSSRINARFRFLRLYVLLHSINPEYKPLDDNCIDRVVIRISECGVFKSILHAVIERKKRDMAR